MGMVRFFFYLFLFLSTSAHAFAQVGTYDLVYIWDKNIDNVLDYKQELEDVLGAEQSRHLRVVGREDGQYGIIYDFNGSAIDSARLMVTQGELLRKGGLSECHAIEDHGYFRLFNVSYGLGPNLAALKKLYSQIYNYLGNEVGKHLFIEKTDSDNYTLIYRRRGDRASTYAVALKHRKILKSKHISADITPENNNPVIFGEASHLDDTDQNNEEKAVAAIVPETPELQNKTVTIAPEKTIPVREVTAALHKVKKDIDNEYKVERDIENYIQDLRRKGSLSSDETTGWMVYDLTTGESLVDINANQLFQAASMIKPFIALAFFHKAKDGKLVYGPKSRAKMEAMIQHSNNAATNWILRVVGGPDECERILKQNYPAIFQNTVIEEYIPAGGRTYRNSAQPSDYVRFLQALWNDELPYGKEIRRLMSLPGRDRIYDGTPIPQGTLVYNKTGTTAHLCGDMGILVPRDKRGRRHPYAVVGIIERSGRAQNYGRWMLSRGNVIRQVSTMVYQEMKKQYQLL